MNQEIITRAIEVIHSKRDYIGGGMDGYVVLSLIDENGYPTSSAATISKADGIKWMSFISDADGNKARRIAKCNKACVCLATNKYNITLVGTMEILTDPKVKKKHWQEIYTGAYDAPPEDPRYCVYLFNTERYNIFFSEGDVVATGELD